MPLHRRLRGFLPNRTLRTARARARAGFGALLAIALTGAVTRAWLGPEGDLPLLVAPMGASAVLLFGVPASLLAQPWNVVGGNVLSAAVGVTCAMVVPEDTIAAATAVGAAIVCMSLCGCLHPPGGAVALTAVVGGPAVEAAGYGFALVPVAVNSALMVGVALAFNNATRHSYPHVAPPVAPVAPRTSDPPPLDRVGFTRTDIEDALVRYGDLLDVSRDDLDVLFRRVETRAHRRLQGTLRTDAIMSRDVVGIGAGATLADVRAALLHHDVRTLPVVDAAGRLLGAVGLADAAAGGEGEAVVGRMRTDVPTARPDTPAEDLVPVLSRGGIHEVMVVDADRRLVGLVSQTDLLAGLYRSRVAEAVAGAAGDDDAPG